MKCKACQVEKEIEFMGLCTECIDILEEIALDKLANNEEPPKQERENEDSSE